MDLQTASVLKDMDRMIQLRKLFADYKIIYDNSPVVMSCRLKEFNLLCIICRINALIVPFFIESPVLTADDKKDLLNVMYKIRTVKRALNVKTDSDLVDLMLEEYKTIMSMGAEFLAAGAETPVLHVLKNKPMKILSTHIIGENTKNKLSASAEEFIPSASRHFKNKSSIRASN